MKKYVLFGNNGAHEGWSIAGEADSLLEICELRESELKTWGRELRIFEHIEPFAAYRQADYAKREN